MVSKRPTVPIVLRQLLNAVAYDLSMVNVSNLTRTWEDG